MNIVGLIDDNLIRLVEMNFLAAVLIYKLQLDFSG